MPYRILWIEFAEEDLDSIYNFYADTKNTKAAIKIFNEILDAADTLIDFPQKGAIEQELSGLQGDYRSLLVRKHFKIIYYLEEESIFIAAVWDCRQNPQTNISKIK